MSLTTEACANAENNLKIINNQPKNGVKKKFGVCLKQITYEDRSFAIKFIEWVHLLRILGAEKVHLSNRFVHPETYKAMKYFEKLGYIEVKPFLEPTGVPDIKHEWEARTLELNMINDCFYRVINIYEFIVIIDPDEVIMPKSGSIKSWNQLLDSVDYKSRNVDAYLSRSVTFPPLKAIANPEIPKYHYILQHFQRNERFLSFRAPYTNHKAILSPDNILSVFNHGYLECFERQCTNFTFPTNVAQLNHYRDEEKVASNGQTVVDTTVWKFKDELVRDVKETIENMKFEP